jgi:hypothetical protein
LTHLRARLPDGRRSRKVPDERQTAVVLSKGVIVARRILNCDFQLVLYDDLLNLVALVTKFVSQLNILRVNGFLRNPKLSINV